MKLKFTAEQKMRMNEAKERENQEIEQRRKRMNNIVSREALIVARRLCRLPELKAKTRLRKAIASLIAPYVQATRHRAVSAFARSH